MISELRHHIKCYPRLHGAVRRTRKAAFKAGFRVAHEVVEVSRRHEILVVFGLRRSGNHVAINWIMNQTDGSAVFFNNINPDLPPWTARMREFRLRARNRSPRIILSYEDVSLDRLLSDPLLSTFRASSAIRIRFALILRDPYNLFASRLRKWPDRFAGREATQAALYTEHAELARDPRPIWRDAPLVPILYNDLVQNPAARTRIADALGICDGNWGLETVPVYGHGSSFDGTEGQVAHMRNQVFLRWREMEADPTFRKVISDPALQYAGQTLFGMPPPVGNGD